jgi:hypothetical protein
METAQRLPQEVNHVCQPYAPSDIIGPVSNLVPIFCLFPMRHLTLPHFLCKHDGMACDVPLDDSSRHSGRDMGFGTVFMVFIALAIAYAVFASYLRRWSTRRPRMDDSTWCRSGPTLRGRGPAGVGHEGHDRAGQAHGRQVPERRTYSAWPTTWTSGHIGGQRDQRVHELHGRQGRQDGHVCEQVDKAGTFVAKNVILYVAIHELGTS